MLPVLMLMRGVEELKAVEDSSRFATMPVDDLRHDLVRALESLSAPHREVILLRDMQEMTIGEIARSLNITRAATKRDRKSTRLNSSHLKLSRMPSSA